MAFSEEYFINVLGEQKGPYTFPQLKRMYEMNLIPEETSYWQDGMEQWESVADLCGEKQRDKLRHLKQLKIAGLALVATMVMAMAYCAPMLKDGWREMNDRDQTQEGAYWKARGFVREDVKKEEASVAFDPYQPAGISLSGTNATVILPGMLFGKDGRGTKMTWKVVMGYDREKREWRLPGG